MAARSVALLDSSPEARDIRKALFQTPTSPDTPITGTTKSLMNSLLAEQENEACFRAVKKEDHEIRLKELRKLQKELEEDNWRYPSVEALKLH